MLPALLIKFVPYLIVLVIVGGLCDYIFEQGKKVERSVWQAKELSVVQDMMKHSEQQAITDNKTLFDYSVNKETVKTVYVKVKDKANEDIKKNPAYAECSLDTNGLQLYNSH